MSETKTCNPEMLLAGFAKLSPEDQEKVRAKILSGAAGSWEPSCCDPSAIMERMMGMMKAKGVDPIEMCKEMMGKKPRGERSARACCGEKEDGR